MAEVDDSVTFHQLDCDKLIQSMCAIVNDVVQKTGLNPTVSRLLLSYFKWDADRLLEYYYMSDDDASKTELFKKAGIAPENFCPAVSAESDSPGQCQICLCDYEDSELSSVGCGHKFCSQCWQQYMETKIHSDSASHIVCPQTNCDVLIADELVLQMVKNAESKRLYARAITDSFVQSNRRLAWCIGIDCDHAFKCNDVVNCHRAPAKCTCSAQFCFKCRSEWHEPILCKYLREWHNKCADKDHNETMNYIISQTKDCPNCKVCIIIKFLLIEMVISLQ